MFILLWEKVKIYHDYAYLKSKGIDTELGYVTLVGLPQIHKTQGSTIRLGKNCVLISKSKGNYAGINHRVILATTSKNAQIIIGDNFGASGSSIVAQNSIIVGNNSGLGVNSHIYDTDFHPVGWRINKTIKSSPVKIGDFVWIAANCLILKGVSLADDTVVAAGSIVTKSNKPQTIIGGNPALEIKKIEF